MTRPEKASEPSMEEILASIRKIIAEEPIGSRPGPASLPGLPDELRSGRSGGDGHDRGEPGRLPFPERDSSNDESAYSVEDALADLIDDGSERNERGAVRHEPDAGFAARPGQIADQPNAENAHRPGWLFSRPAALGPSTGAPASGSPNPSGGSANPLDMLRQAPAASQGGAGLATAKPFSDLPLPGQRLAEPSLPVLDDKSTRPGFPDLTPKPAQSRPAAAESNLARQASMPAPGAEQKNAAGLSGAAVRADSVRKAEPAAPLTGETVPNPAPRPLDVPAAKPSQPAGNTEVPAPQEGVKAASAGKEAVAKPLASEPVRRPELSALDALAQGLSGSKPVAKPAPAPKPTVSAAESAPEVKPSPVEMATGRTLEDTVADLLRPMLRDWLDANMPRIVEKALRVELAANAQRPGKPDQN